MSMISKMGSCELAFKILITLLLFLFLFISPSHVTASYSNIDGIEVSFSANPENVNLSVYYETLSANCSYFIVKNLESVFNNDLISIINLRLVPWGDAYFNKSNNAIVCKHGPDECLLNEVEACAINVLNDVNKYYGFIYCIEFLAIEGRHKDWKTCFNTLGLPEKPILNCYNSGNGTKLALQYGNETAHLIPPHTIVPWVVVNNQLTGNDYENFTTYVCKAYKGNVVPKACKSPSLAINSVNMVNSINPVSDAKKWTSSKPDIRSTLFYIFIFCLVNLAITANLQFAN